MSEAHTPGRVTFKEDGDANHYSMLTEDGRWWLAVLVNGEQTSERQIANFRRLAACWNRLEQFTTEQIEDFGYDLAGTAEWVAREQELYRRARGMELQRDRLLELLKQFDSIMEGCGNWPDTSTSQVNLGDLATEVRAVIAAQKVRSEPAICNWKEVAPGGWYSDCGQEFWLEDGTPSENSMQFCHKCGKPLAEHPHQEDNDE